MTHMGALNMNGDENEQYMCSLTSGFDAII